MNKKIILHGILILVFISIIYSPVLAAKKETCKLFYPGTETIVNYEKYGTFKGIGTSEYKYTIKDPRGLAKAVGIGIFPNRNIYQDSEYKGLQKAGKLDGSPWDYVLNPHYKRNFYKWASLEQIDGAKQFFTAIALKELGLIEHAIKAYYAVIVHFPKDACWGKDGSFVWYVGPTAISEIKNLLRQYPELGLDLEGARIIIKNGKDTNLYNDIVIVDPGKFVRIDPNRRKKNKYNLKSLDIIQTLGEGKVRLIQYDNYHWQLLVNNKPFFIKGVVYTPTQIGFMPDRTNSLNEWMHLDTDKNGLIDAPYESWIDKNKNNIKDKNEKAIGDFKMLKGMGCNTIVIFYDSMDPSYNPKEINKQLLRELHEKYGIYVIMGNLLGAYTVGSGASWEDGTDYTNEKQRKRMKEIVKQQVLDHKDEPYILLWQLGNENNLPVGYTGINATRTNAFSFPGAYAEFLNEVAMMIHELDPDHPVSVGNADVSLIDIYAQYAPAIDILGINAYRGKEGFGYLWPQVQDIFDRPILISEYGSDAYREAKGEDENMQVNYHKNCWDDILYNKAGGWAQGNCIGGCIFEWVDEWWKDNISGDSPSRHQTDSQQDMNFPDGRSHEEWFGVCSQGNGKSSPFLRQPRKTYYFYKKSWNKNSGN